MKNKIKFLVVLTLLCQLSFSFAQTKKTQAKAADTKEVKAEEAKEAPKTKTEELNAKVAELETANTELQTKIDTLTSEITTEEDAALEIQKKIANITAMTEKISAESTNILYLSEVAIDADAKANAVTSYEKLTATKEKLATESANLKKELTEKTNAIMQKRYELSDATYKINANAFEIKKIKNEIDAIAAQNSLLTDSVSQGDALITEAELLIPAEEQPAEGEEAENAKPAEENKTDTSKAKKK